MENYENQNPENTDQNQGELNNAEPMEKDDIINPEQFQVGRTAETENDDDQDDSEYTPEENEFADGKGSLLAEEFDSPDPEDFDEEESEEMEDE